MEVPSLKFICTIKSIFMFHNFTNIVIVKTVNYDCYIMFLQFSIIVRRVINMISHLRNKLTNHKINNK